MKLKINLNNTWGIEKLNHEFDFNNKKMKLIYSPNGTGKTSLKNALEIVSKEKKGKNKITQKNIKYDLNNFKNFIVFNSFEDYSLKYGVEVFESSMQKIEKLNEKRSILFNIIKKNKNLNLVSEIYNKITQKEENFILNNKNSNINYNYFSIQENIINFYNKNKNKIEFLSEEDIIFFKINLNNIFNIKILIKYEDDFDRILDMTLKRINLKNSTKLPKNVSFDSLNLVSEFFKNKGFIISEIFKMIENENVVNNLKNINNVIDSEFDNIKEELEKLNFKDKSEKEFSLLLEEVLNRFDINNFSDFIQLRDNVVLNILKEEESLINKIQNLINEYEILLPTIDKQEKNWIKIKDIYESLFNTKAKFELEKRNEDISGKLIYNVVIKHSNQDETIDFLEEKDIRKNLSESELRSLYFFDIMHKLNHIAVNNDIDKVIVLDDIVDSFDQRNITALVCYFSELMSKYKNLNFIILTHNYTFFNQLSKKVKESESFIMKKRDDFHYIDKIEVSDYIFDNWNNVEELIKDDKKIIGSLILTRELSGKNYSYNKSKDLIKYFHIKEETNNLKKKDLLKNISNITGDLDISLFNNIEDSYLDMVFNIADNLLNIQDPFVIKKHLINSFIEETKNYNSNDKINKSEFDNLKIILNKLKNLDFKKSIYKKIVDIFNRTRLPKNLNCIIDLREDFIKELKIKKIEIADDILNKACLSLAIRIKLEKFIIENSKNNLNLPNIKKDQTISLLNSATDLDYLNLRPYEIATSNIIHLSSLNYEPLFYYDFEDLKILYQTISNLKK